MPGRARSGVEGFPDVVVELVREIGVHAGLV